MTIELRNSASFQVKLLLCRDEPDIARACAALGAMQSTGLVTGGTRGASKNYVYDSCHRDVSNPKGQLDGREACLDQVGPTENKHAT